MIALFVFERCKNARTCPSSRALLCLMKATRETRCQTLRRSPTCAGNSLVRFATARLPPETSSLRCLRARLSSRRWSFLSTVQARLSFVCCFRKQNVLTSGPIIDAVVESAVSTGRLLKPLIERSGSILKGVHETNALEKKFYLAFALFQVSYDCIVHCTS